MLKLRGGRHQIVGALVAGWQRWLVEVLAKLDADQLGGGALLQARAHEIEGQDERVGRGGEGVVEDRIERLREWLRGSESSAAELPSEASHCREAIRT